MQHAGELKAVHEHKHKRSRFPVRVARSKSSSSTQRYCPRAKPVRVYERTSAQSIRAACASRQVFYIPMSTDAELFLLRASDGAETVARKKLHTAPYSDRLGDGSHVKRVRSPQSRRVELFNGHPCATIIDQVTTAAVLAASYAAWVSVSVHTCFVAEKLSFPY
uniref:Uncharacterized protein n=1 Tax=Trichogramma kaykai TaxID=54128 RepID=A0ABD2WP71_9HYME